MYPGEFKKGSLERVRVTETYIFYVTAPNSTHIALSCCSSSLGCQSCSLNERAHRCVFLPGLVVHTADLHNTHTDSHTTSDKGSQFQGWYHWPGSKNTDTGWRLPGPLPASSSGRFAPPRAWQCTECSKVNEVRICSGKGGQRSCHETCE